MWTFPCKKGNKIEERNVVLLHEGIHISLLGYGHSLVAKKGLLHQGDFTRAMDSHGKWSNTMTPKWNLRTI